MLSTHICQRQFSFGSGGDGSRTRNDSTIMEVKIKRTGSQPMRLVAGMVKSRQKLKLVPLATPKQAQSTLIGADDGGAMYERLRNCVENPVYLVSTQKNVVPVTNLWGCPEETSAGSTQQERCVLVLARSMG